MCPGGTIFPEGPALGSTWNMELLGRVYAAVAREARSIGVHQNFTLVIEPIRDPRLGRNEEAFSEDPFLCADRGDHRPLGAGQATFPPPDKVVTGLCHYPGQSQPVSGLERGAMEVSERAMREVFLPPWQAGIQKCGALGVMATYPAIDGMPTHASKKLLTRILRQEFGFDGLVLSEGGGIGTLVYEGLAATQKEAGALALAAGVDVGISFESGYMQDLLASVREGKVPMGLVDRSRAPHPQAEVPPGPVREAAGGRGARGPDGPSPEHQDLALEAAREAIVLLKNEKGLLPLKKTLRSIAVIGPNADDAAQPARRLRPAQDPPAHRHGAGRHPADRLCRDRGDLRQRLRSDWARSRTRSPRPSRRRPVPTWPSWSWARANHWGQEQAVHQRRRPRRRHAGIDRPPGGTGEGRAGHRHAHGGRADQRPPAGRPLDRPARRRPIVEAWLPGEKGGQAVAEVLFGDVNPSGKLSVTVPRHVGQLPVYYNFKKSKRYWLNDTAGATPTWTWSPRRSIPSATG